LVKIVDFMIQILPEAMLASGAKARRREAGAL
jgi:hypothetical protein